ncbi:hypothetical protein CC86DRAFT_75073 [Ophiobolus disseminans]|uniref:BTB domain-containing protein n=1 Tax=Ophiobolus disseminans TaxID=1469910 RepID=A0A6A6ZQD3_9PLEO|nr:hypothetical protein CC86DRAFT_75073 [Ophiobolus disseminans]
MAHKSILRENSPYFQRMFSFPGKEVTENKVEIKHADPRIMYWVLEFMYTGAYAPPDGTTVSTEYCNHDRASYKYATASAGGILKKKCPCAGKTTSPNHLLAHIHVYSIADYFGMRTLMAFAQQKVVEVLHVHWQDDKLQLKNALEKAFSNTPEYNRGLRQVLIDVLKAHPGLWVDDGDVRSWLDAHLRVREEVDYA